jgi:ADP-heptose:LPS heptosyltransferase
MQALTRSYADLDALPWLAFVTPAPVDRTVCFVMERYGQAIGAMRRALEEERPDAVFVLPYVGEPLGAKLKKLMFFWMAGFRGPIFGFDGLASRGCLEHRQFRMGLYEHAVFGPVRAISECPAIGPVEESEIVQQIAIPDNAMAWARRTLQDSGISATMMVAISPGASFAHKIWPVECFVLLGEALLERYACRLIVVGSEGDRPLGEALRSRLGSRCFDLTGKTSVTELAALLAQCRLFVGNDSGVAHLASSAGCPAVTITSALDFPGMWEPWNSRDRIARVRIACEHCLSLTSCPLKTNACIRAVDPQEVLRLCAQVLGNALGDALKPGRVADRPAW